MLDLFGRINIYLDATPGRRRDGADGQSNYIL
jgi:hypothetical protein